MDIGNILNLLGDKENITVRLYFTRKKQNNSYVSYSPVIDDDVSSALLDLISGYLERCRGLEIREFSPIGSLDDTLESYVTTEISNYSHVIESYEEGLVEREYIDEDIINKLSFYCLALSHDKDGEKTEFKIFRRLTKFKKLSSKGMLGWIRDNRFNKLDSNMIGIDSDIDIIVKDDDIIIFNHISLERIFSINDQYTIEANNAIAKIKNANRIENFEMFQEDCINDRRMTRILTKLLKEENKLDDCFENFANVKLVVNLFELDIEITEVDGIEMLIYERKEQLMDVIRLVRDSYYKSFINERNGVDDSL